LKKDSQRRATLGKILKDDKHRICREWHSLLVKDVHDVVLSVEHLGTLVEGMKGYIEGAKNTNPLEKAVQDLRNALDYDGAGMNHLQLALYKVPEALNKVLRGHSIKPHWMFALEDLVRTAVQEAIGIISPELGAHLGTVHSQHPVEGILLVDHVDHHVPEMAHDNEGGSTSGVSTVSQRVGHGQVLSGLGRLREENRHLLSDLMKAQESYQDLLRQSLGEQRLHLQMLSQSLAASSLVQTQPHAAGVQRQAGVVEGPADPDLVHWLEGLQLNQESMDRILGEELVLTDVLEVMGREDLKGLGLKAGPELRVWRAILAHRNIPLTPTSP
jgi:mitogen-activated protein kinase kinase kinase 5